MISQETANGALSMVWDNNTLTITYELHTGDYYEKKYEESEIIEIHPLFRLDPSLLKDYIDENKAMVDIEGQKAIISYNVVHARRGYSFVLTANLQEYRSMFNRFLALEAKVCSIDKKTSWIADGIYTGFGSLEDYIEHELSGNDDEIRTRIYRVEKDLEDLGDLENLKDIIDEKVEELKDDIYEGFILEETVNEKLEKLEEKIKENVCYDYLETRLNEKLEDIKDKIDEKLEELKKNISKRIYSDDIEESDVEETLEERTKYLEWQLGDINNKLYDIKKLEAGINKNTVDLKETDKLVSICLLFVLVYMIYALITFMYELIEYVYTITFTQLHIDTNILIDSGAINSASFVLYLIYILYYV